MTLSFTVGSVERHDVQFKFNKAIGNLVISVDGTPVIRDFRLFSLRLTKCYEFSVGVEEQHVVTIKKVRHAAFAGFRPQDVYAYVNGVEVAQGIT